MANDSPRARVSLYIEATPAAVYDAFVEPQHLKRFWLQDASAPLALNTPVQWDFLVEGATAHTTATVMEPGRRLAWTWETSRVQVELKPFDGGTAVTLINDRFTEPGTDPVDSALNATEGFALVLADLKTLLESGASAGITAAKAKLIAAMLRSS